MLDTCPRPVTPSPTIAMSKILEMSLWRHTFLREFITRVKNKEFVKRGKETTR